MSRSRNATFWPELSCSSMELSCSRKARSLSSTKTTWSATARLRCSRSCLAAQTASSLRPSLLVTWRRLAAIFGFLRARIDVRRALRGTRNRKSLGSFCISHCQRTPPAERTGRPSAQSAARESSYLTLQRLCQLKTGSSAEGRRLRFANVLRGAASPMTGAVVRSLTKSAHSAEKVCDGAHPLSSLTVHQSLRNAGFNPISQCD